MNYLIKGDINLKININKLLILIPTLITFLIVLIPTLKYQWPFSWDIIFHIEYAKIYSEQGYQFQYNYPPLFHLMLVFLGNIFNNQYFQIARFLQPILATIIVFSISYVAKKFYGNIAGISAGFLILSSYLIFRIMLPIPENLALIFLIFSVYFYYISYNKNKLKYALISGILLLITFGIHRYTPLFLILIISLFTLVELIIYKNLSVLKNYATFLISSVIAIIIAAFAILLLNPNLIFEILQQGILIYSNYLITSSNINSYNIYQYIKFFGPLLLIFSLIGAIFSLKKMVKIGICLIIWTIAIFLISNAYLFGLYLDSSRFLIYILIPLSMLGGYGLSRIYYKLKDLKRFSSSISAGFLVLIFIISSISGVITLIEPNINHFYANTSLGDVQIAPPSQFEVDIANWFNENGDDKKNVIVSNGFTGVFLKTVTNMSINPNFEDYNKNTSESEFNKKNIGYIVLDKRLTFQSTNGTFYMKETSSELDQSYKLFFYSRNINDNLNKIIPSYAQVVYENKDFIIIKI